MSLKNVKPSLDKISKSLESTHASREYLIKNGREVITLCSQAIISVHKGDIKSAKNKMNKAKSQLSKLRKHATGGLRYHIITPEQEFVETASLLSVIEKKPIPTIKSLQVSNEAYLLGLLDCIGELKRLVFDKIRSGKGKEAVKIFDIMEKNSIISNLQLTKREIFYNLPLMDNEWFYCRLNNNNELSG